MKDKIKILIADDHPVIRRGLASVISADKQLELVGEAENGKIALEMLKALSPDIVILDIDMPVLDGVQTQKFIRHKYPEIKTIFLSMHKDQEILNSLKSLQVNGYVIKDGAVMEIVDCIKKVAKNEMFISPSIKELLIHISENFLLDISSDISALSPTEMRILRHISESKTNREIAESMFISIRTVENHRFNICSKLKLRGNHALLKFALDNKTTLISGMNDEKAK